MSERFYYDEFAEDIFDSEVDDYPTTRDICSLLNELEHNQNQKAIECLKEIRKKLFGTEELDIVVYIASIQDAMILIDSKIKELEGEKE